MSQIITSTVCLLNNLNHSSNLYYVRFIKKQFKSPGIKQPEDWIDGNRLFLLSSSLQTSLASSKVVRTHSLGARGKHDVHIASVVLLSLLQHQINTKQYCRFNSYLSTTDVGLGLLLSLNLGGLVSHLSGTSQRTVHLTSTDNAESESESGLLLHVALIEGAGISKLLSSKHETLSLSSNSLLLLDHGLDVLDQGGGLDRESGLSYNINR